MINKYQKLFKQENDESHFWPSFTDLLTTILICFILFFLVSSVIFQNKIQGIIKYQQTIDQIMGIRLKIVEALKEEFKDTELDISIDSDTGAISFSSDINFPYAKSNITEQFKTDLNEFIPRYMNVLLRDEFDDYIAEIIVVGHTDKKGDYMYNLRLSQERAFSVVNYINSSEFPDQSLGKKLSAKLTVNGRSFMDEIKDEDGKYNSDKSRRVEFKFRLKDTEILEETRLLLEK
jgi:outer membrane protein OmpA-like peptidoglycan-associated protein